MNNFLKFCSEAQFPLLFDEALKILEIKNSIQKSDSPKTPKTNKISEKVETADHSVKSLTDANYLSPHISTDCEVENVEKDIEDNKISSLQCISADNIYKKTYELLDTLLEGGENLNNFLKSTREISNKEDSAPSIEMIDSLVFGNTSGNLFSSTTIGSTTNINNIDVESTSAIDLSNNSNSSLENYIVLRKRILKNQERTINNSKSIKEMTASCQRKTIYTHYIGG